MTAGFALVAAARWRLGSSRGVIVTLLAIAAVFCLSALAAPRILNVPHRLWIAFGDGLAWFNTRLILTLVFFLAVTPTGLVMRLFGRSPLEQRHRASYWEVNPVDEYRSANMEKQF
jgi:hypothetical protein